MEKERKPTYRRLFVNLLMELGWLVSGTEQMQENMQEEVIPLRICYKGLKMLYEEYEERLKKREEK